MNQENNNRQRTLAYWMVVLYVAAMFGFIWVSGCDKSNVHPEAGIVPEWLSPYEVVAQSGDLLILKNGDHVQNPISTRLKLREGLEIPDSTCLKIIDSLRVEDGGRYDILKYFAFKGGYAYLIHQERRVNTLNYDTDPKNIFYTMVWSKRWHYPGQSFYLTD